MSWLLQVWHDIKEAQNDKEHVVEAKFPYHNGKGKVYFSREDMINSKEEDAI